MTDHAALIAELRELAVKHASDLAKIATSLAAPVPPPFPSNFPCGCSVYLGCRVHHRPECKCVDGVATRVPPLDAQETRILLTRIDFARPTLKDNPSVRWLLDDIAQFLAGASPQPEPDQ